MAVSTEFQEIAEYLLTCARVSGFGQRKSGEGEQLELTAESMPPNLSEHQANYSLEWYYRHYLIHDLEYGESGENLLRTFLLNAPKSRPDTGKGEALAEGPDTGTGETLAGNPDAKADETADKAENVAAAIRDNQSTWFPGNPMNDAQIRAVANAMTYPMSFVQGPPGTGKTMMIVRLIAQAVAAGETVAVVSSNSAAVANVKEKLDEIAAEYKGTPIDGGKATDGDAGANGNRLRTASERFAFLGSAKVREEFANSTAADRWQGTGLFANPITAKEEVPFDYPAFDDSAMLGARSGWERHVTFRQFTSIFPVVMSTVHSLKKCFIDGARPENKFDLVIVDESSQTNLLVGLVAMSCAKRMVLVGDECQLPPIIGDTLPLLGKWPQTKAVHEKLRGSDLDVTRENESFLTACKRVFRQQPGYAGAETFLNEHYRCHPGIIQFCADNIYDVPGAGKKLEIKTRRESLDTGDIRMPISVVHYSGDYREPVRVNPDKEKPTGQNAADSDRAKERWTSRNRRQVEILRHEFGEHIRGAVADGKSVCLLTPFRGQVKELETLLKELLDDVDAEVTANEVQPNEETTIAPLGSVTARPQKDGKTAAVAKADEKKASGETTTVYKSQGREFDVVYLLPVEDGIWEWPWSQGMRLVNVAVSRAKEQLHVIVSTKMMSEKAQTALTGCIIPTRARPSEEDAQRQQQLYVRKLVDYVHGSPTTDNPGATKALPEFGVRPTSLTSIFDDVVWFQDPSKKNAGKNSAAKNAGKPNRTRDVVEESAPAVCVQAALFKILENRPDLGLMVEVPLEDDVKVNGKSLRRFLMEEGVAVEVLEYACQEGTKFDIAVVHKATGAPVLIVEVDGKHHRTEDEVKANDGYKDSLVEKLGGVVLHRNAREGQPALPDNGFALLRLPTDGTTKWETRKLAREATLAGHDPSGVFTFEDLIEHFAPHVATRTPSVTLTMPYAEPNERHRIEPGTTDLKSYMSFKSEWEKLDPGAFRRVLGGRTSPSSDIQEALMERGYLEKPDDGDGRYNVPTVKGHHLGIRGVSKTDRNGKPFHNIEYTAGARKFLRDNLETFLKSAEANAEENAAANAEKNAAANAEENAEPKAAVKGAK